MTKLYLIVEGNGEYSDRSEMPRWAYRDRDKAQARMAELEKIASTGPFHRSIEYPTEQALAARADAYKALLGARVENVSSLADWELCEIELIEDA